MTAKAIQRGIEFYSNFIETIIECDNVQSVEAAKILENTYRLINISFINQFASATRSVGLNPEEIIDLASTKGFGFEKFVPGPKVGGHCIPVDPVFLQFYLNKSKVSIPMLDDSLTYNQRRAQEIVNHVISKTNKPLNEQTILLVGMTYKPNIKDVRNSAGQDLFNELEKHGALVKWHDDIAHQIISKFSTDIAYKCDTAIIVTKHDYMDLSRINAETIIDVSSGI
jgi:UDP-N-acetyl-D-glucosamine dehydrogenase